MHRKTKLVFLALVIGLLLSVLVAGCASFKPALVPYMGMTRGELYESFPDCQQTEVIGGDGFTVVVWLRPRPAAPRGGNATYYFGRDGKLTAFGPIVKL